MHRADIHQGGFDVEQFLGDVERREGNLDLEPGVKERIDRTGDFDGAEEAFAQFLNHFADMQLAVIVRVLEKGADRKSEAAIDTELDEIAGIHGNARLEFAGSRQDRHVPARAIGILARADVEAVEHIHGIVAGVGNQFADARGVVAERHLALDIQ